ncbi:RluA family pseudouridine synthase [Spiroplasma endosymbiont of Amphibalanus improvisus]|uniref:RluA family pseudouridine synthase n=1 Tax=Spiroplasma endosymbiont of Amphibalanus improvisus TaxID=3066327 RepID=UPI00313B0459
MKKTEIIIKANDAEQTIFKFIKKICPQTSISIIYKWFRNKDIQVNDQRINDRNYIVKINDVIIIYDNNVHIISRGNNIRILENNKLDIIYEDQNIMIVIKPHNIEMHNNDNDIICMDKKVRSYFAKNAKYNPKRENSFIISSVNRLDKFTTGLVLYAKNKKALNYFNDIINNKEKVKKYYLAKVEGKFKNSNITVSGFLHKDATSKKMVFNNKSENDFNKLCETKFKVLVSNKEYSILKIKLITGKKHQIRATLEFLGHPIWNDQKYSSGHITDNKMIYLYAYILNFGKLDNEFDYLSSKFFKMKNINSELNKYLKL